MEGGRECKITQGEHSGSLYALNCCSTTDFQRPAYNRTRGKRGNKESTETTAAWESLGAPRATHAPRNYNQRSLRACVRACTLNTQPDVFQASQPATAFHVKTAARLAWALQFRSLLRVNKVSSWRRRIRSEERESTSALYCQHWQLIFRCKNALHSFRFRSTVFLHLQEH